MLKGREIGKNRRGRMGKQKKAGQRKKGRRV